MRNAGFVLAGGASSRMGREKALLALDGRAMIEVVAEAVLRAAGSVTIVGRPELFETLPLDSIADKRPGCGPLSGIETVLKYTISDWNLIVACDMPHIQLNVLQAILAATSDASDCVLPRAPDGFLEPLCAAYHRRLLPRITAALDLGTYKVTKALEGAAIEYLPVVPGSAFTNVNTPGDWRRVLEGE